MSAPEHLCLHCGTPVPPTAANASFCCAGCEFVYDMLHEQGFDKFYDLRGGQSLSPVAPQALRERDYEWLTNMVTEAENTCEPCKPAQLELAVQGLSCVGCVWLIEKVFQQSQGAVRIEIHAPRGELHLEWMRGVFDVVEFARQLQRFGYLVGRVNEEAQASSLSPITRRMGLCGAFAMNAMAFSLPAYLGMSPDFMFAAWFDIIAAASATLALIVGGSYFAGRSYQALRHGVLHIDTPITLGIGVAWIGSMIGWASGEAGLKYFDFVAIFIFLMLAGRLLQQAAVERNRRRLLQSASVPETVRRVGKEGKREEALLIDIRVGDTLILKQGEVCPVTSHLHTSSASLSLEWINGESEAAQRTEGQAVPSGALNIGSGSIEVIAQESWKESLLQRLLKGKESSHEVSPFVAGLLRWYLAVVVVIGIAGGVTWLATGHGLAKALQVMISVFVVSCPCALGVTAPFADDLAAAWMQRLGVFVRSNFLWQRLARVRKVVFDKTGTLTLENPVLTNPEALSALNESQRAALRVLVGSNLHPVSRSLFDSLGPVKHELKVEDGAVEEVIGQGLRFTDAAGDVYALGRPGWRGGEQSETGADADTEFSLNGNVLTAFCFEDALRPETVAAFDLLRTKHLGLHLLSGDRRAKVAHTAEVLGLEKGNWQAEMTPDEKAHWVAGLNEQDTLYIGDGANDSLALEAALCAGSPVTGRNFLEHKADFYFLGNSLRFVPALLDVAIRRRTAVRCVFGFALLYNLCAVMLSLAGHMSPLLAAILMPLSSIVTLGIARMIFGRQGDLTPVSKGGLEQRLTPSGQLVRGQTHAVPV